MVTSPLSVPNVCGFLRVLGPNQLAYADFCGNTQLISVGNLSENNRCSLILMDYPKCRRLKLLGYIRVEDVRTVSSEVIAQVELPDYKARIERIAFIEVVAFDWNCPQHITRRYTELEFTELASQHSVNSGKTRAIRVRAQFSLILETIEI